MRKILTITLLLLSSAVFSQIKPVNFDGCKYDMFFVSADAQPSWKADSLNLASWLNGYFARQPEKIPVDASGRIILGIIIYEDGHTCCHSFIDLTKNKLDPEIFPRAVFQMPKWKPARQNGKPVIFLNNLVLEIKDGLFR